MKKNFIILFLIALIPIKAFALIEVDITRGNLNPLPLAVSPLSIDDKSKKSFEKILKKENIGSEISTIVENNLRTSGLFNPLSKEAFLQAPDIANLKPRFEDWNLIKAQALITGKVTYVDEKLRVEFRLWDVLAAKEMMALAFTTVPSNWRRVGHIISDKVYERLTGEKGYFDTRIIYVAEEGPKTQRKKRLAIMDQDGANNKFLTLGNELVLTPRFNPTSQMVTYLSYFKNLPRVYLLDIETGTQEVVGDFPGMTFAPRFSPDGKKIIMSFAKDGKSDIYTMDLENRLVERITNHPSIDTSPSYSPNGKFIAFNSDRSGYQQIYIMKSDGSDVKRNFIWKWYLWHTCLVTQRRLDSIYKTT
jgi:TolB protein